MLRCPGDAGGISNREGHPRPFLRKSLETPDIRGGPQEDGGKTEPGHHDGEPVHDVRVSPIDNVPTTPRRTTRVVRHDNPGLEPTGLLRDQAEQHEVHVVVHKIAVTKHHERPPSESTLDSFRVGKKDHEQVSPREP